MTELQGLSAPFLLSWLPFWVFCAFGGLASAFIKIDNTDHRLRRPFIAKTLIGTMSGMAMVLYLNQNAEPPLSTLLLWCLYPTKNAKTSCTNRHKISLSLGQKRSETMSNMLIINALICVVGFGLGAYTFIRHLQAFSHAKTPTVDSWLVAVGTLAWSVALYASFDDNNITHAELFCRVLFLVYWIGDILKVQKHCIKIRRRFRRNRP